MSLKDAFNIETIFPFRAWLKDYKNTDLLRDFVAGLTVAIILIPQVMAYAILAGLPPVHGLYAAFLGTAVAAFWGSSRHLSTGPAALVSFLVLTALVPLAKPESAEFVVLAIVLALMIGVIQLLMGLFKLGFIMNFISHSVLSGFTVAAAIIITATQIPSLGGFEVEKHEYVFLNFYEILRDIPQTNLLTLLIGLVSILLMLFVKRKVSKAFPIALVVILIGIFLSYELDFDTSVADTDKVFEDNGVRIIVDKKSFLYLAGTVLEYSGGLNGKGFVFNNPNAQRTCGCGESFSL